MLWGREEADEEKTPNQTELKKKKYFKGRLSKKRHSWHSCEGKKLSILDTDSIFSGVLCGGIVISEALRMHQQSACQKSSLPHNSVQKHCQKELLIRSDSISIDEFGGEQKPAVIPGLSYIGSDHNLSNSRRRSLEHLRSERQKLSSTSDIGKREKKHGHIREKCKKTPQKNKGSWPAFD